MQSRFKRALWGITALVCLGAAGTLAVRLSKHSRSPHPSRVFQISVQSLNEWKPYGGRWSIENDSIHNDSDERGAKLVSGSTRWSNYTLRADLRFDGNHGDMGAIVRSSDGDEGVDAYNGYYAGLRTSDSTLIIGRADYGWLEVRPVRMPGGVHASDWYRLTITAYGCLIAARAENLTTHAVAWTALEEQPCAATGRIGLRSMATGGRWRNIVVQPASQAEYLRIRRHLPQVSPPEFPKREADYNSLTPIVPFVPATAPQSQETAAPRSTLNEAAPITHIGDLLEMPRSALRHVTLRGVVTLTSPYLFVQDSSGGIFVRSRVAPVLNIGDVVEVRGHAQPGLFSSQLDADSIRQLWSGTPLPAFSITPSQAASGTYDGRYIEVEGRLTGSETAVDGARVLNLTDGVQSFRAIAEVRDNDHPTPIANDSYVRVRGICELDQAFTRGLTPFVVLLGSADDAQVLANPPWWNLRHVTLVFGGALIIILLLQMLYFRVQQWKSAAITRERDRLAHDIHDTMAQGFAGIGYQIQGIRRIVRQRDDPESNRVSEQLKTAYQLVRRCHEEASRTIAMLAESAPGIQDDLLTFLNEAARQITKDQVRILVRTEGTATTLDLRTANALMYIGREAITNAAAHAQPTELILSLRFGHGDIELRIRDNGNGFHYDPDTAGFGILGMRKRAREIGGALEILSSPGNGTEVCVRVVLRSQRVARRLIQAMKKKMARESATPKV